MKSTKMQIMMILGVGAALGYIAACDQQAAQP